MSSCYRRNGSGPYGPVVYSILRSKAAFKNPKTDRQLQIRVIVISGKRPHMIPYEMVRLTLVGRFKVSPRGRRTAVWIVCHSKLMSLAFHREMNTPSHASVQCVTFYSAGIHWTWTMCQDLALAPTKETHWCSRIKTVIFITVVWDGKVGMVECRHVSGQANK